VRSVLASTGSAKQEGRRSGPKPERRFISMQSPPYDPAFWHGRAAEARAAATQMGDQLPRTAMRVLAARYERLASRIVSVEQEARKTSIV
jgi:hypothetical protein